MDWVAARWKYGIRQSDLDTQVGALRAHCLPRDLITNQRRVLLGRHPTGATQHMPFQRSLFTNFRPVCPASRWISGIGQTRVEILGTGDIQLTALGNEAHRSVGSQPKVVMFVLPIRKSVQFATELCCSPVSESATRSIVSTHATAVTAPPTTPGAQLPSVITSLQAYTRPPPNSIQEWHERLAHLNYQMIIKMARSDAITGLTLPPDTQISAEQCHPCAAEKLKCCTFNLSSPPKSTRIDMLISCDLWAPAQTPSLGGAICCSTFCDHCSDYRAAHYLKFKNEVAGSVLDFIRLLHT